MKLSNHINSRLRMEQMTQVSAKGLTKVFQMLGCRHFFVVALQNSTFQSCTIHIFNHSYLRTLVSQEVFPSFFAFICLHRIVLFYSLLNVPLFIISSRVLCPCGSY